MAKESGPGLLGKVVRLVRQPSPFRDEASDAVADSDMESGHGRQLLKELMERRRRNDLVRRREFDQLRRLRRTAGAASSSSAEPVTDGETGISFFLSTTLDNNSDDRAVTLRKIDEIEEQMSRQWWKTRPPEPGDFRPPAAAPGAAAAADAGDSTQGPSTVRGGQRRSRLPPATRQQALSDDPVFDYVPSTPQTVSFAPTSFEEYAPPVARNGAAPPADAPATLPGGPDLELPDAHVLPLPADTETLEALAEPPGVVLAGFVHHPLLEEAAIQFANADPDAAEASLRALIAGPAEGNEEVWHTLFDLYRALGQQERFESTCMEFAERFGRSPPVWLSLAVDTVAVPRASAVDTGDFHWRSPALLNGDAVGRLRAAAGSASGAWWLDWSALEGFEHDAALPLMQAFSAWSEEPVLLYLESAERLLAALEARTLTGASDADPDWWRLRMETLRLMGRIDDFEETALDYCITYEVSPPSWHMPRCDCRALQAGSRGAAAGLLAGWEKEAETEPPVEAAAALSGEVGRDVDDVLARLDLALGPRKKPVRKGQKARDTADAEPVAIDCARLVRLDFVAAGSVLNWAATRHGDGRPVQFRNLHRLVGTFFNVIGINEYARIHVRPD